MPVNFDRVASPYRWMEYASFGPFLERCRSAQIEQLAGARRALVFGDGDGRFLARLLMSNPTLTADVVDSSSSMLRLLDRRISRIGEPARRRVQLHHSDALRWSATGSYDLVISHFFLDCLFPHQIEQLLDRLLPHLGEEAQWIVSEFSTSGNVPASYLFKAVVGLLYRFFGLLTGLPVRDLPGYASFLRERGFVLTREKGFLGRLLLSQLWRRNCYNSVNCFASSACPFKLSGNPRSRI